MSSGLRGMVEWALARTGRRYDISPELTTSMMIGELTTRSIDLLRGILRHQKVAFIGRRVRFRGRSRVRLGRAVSIGRDTELDARGSVGLVLGDSSRLGRLGILTTTSKLSLVGVGLRVGARSGIGDGFHIGASGGVVIGDDVIVGPGLTVHSQTHVFDDPQRPIRDQGTKESEVVVADDCWIGSNVTLLAGTRLGPRTVVASGAVVRGEHPGNEILGGVPARQLRSIEDGAEGGPHRTKLEE